MSLLSQKGFPSEEVSVQDGTAIFRVTRRPVHEPAKSPGVFVDDKDAHPVQAGRVVDQQQTRLDVVFADHSHDEVATTWAAYQHIVTAYRDADRRHGKAALTKTIAKISTNVPAQLAELDLPPPDRLSGARTPGRSRPSLGSAH